MTYAKIYDDEYLNSPVEDSRLFEHISKVDVCVKEVRVECDGLLEVMYRQPDFALCVKNTAEIAPCDSEVWTSFDGFQIAGLSIDGIMR